MTRWLEDNPFGIALASVCLGLLVISLLLAVIWTLPPSSQTVGTENENTAPELDLPELAASETIDKYAVITERPLFRSSRLPAIESDLDDGLGDELLAEEVDAPDVQLTGVIITPSIRMATLRLKQGKTAGQSSLVAFEGRPLEGNFGSWQISRIDHREVTLSSGDGKEVQLKLEVHGVAIAAPPKPDPTASEDRQARVRRAGQGVDQPLSRAEEIRQRIAERREELRRAAEENEQDEKEAKMSYQQAIQAMMGKKRQEKSKNE